MDEKITKLTENDEFVEKIKNVKDSGEFKKIVEQFGFELDETSAEKAYAQFLEGKDKGIDANGELGELELSTVSGGINLNPFYWIGYLLGKIYAKNNSCIPT